MTTDPNRTTPNCKHEYQADVCPYCECERLRAKNSELNRRWQEADLAFRQANEALTNNWTWKGGSFGRALLAYHNSKLDEKLRNAEEVIRDIAWHMWDGASSNWSNADILAHIADYFGVTVKELEHKMETAGD